MDGVSIIPGMSLVVSVILLARETTAAAWASIVVSIKEDRMGIEDGLSTYRHGRGRHGRPGGRLGW